MRPWVTFFSQTGTEINNICNTLGVYPDAIITNRLTTEGVNPNLLSTTTFREHKLNRTIWYMLPLKPDVQAYENILSHYDNPVVTLHGYLRIIPKAICEKYEIYNLHPGLIDKYPELKGFNPQERAFKGGYDLAGCVIHKVIPEVDAGELIMGQGVSIKNKTLDEVYAALHACASDLWKSFFTAYNILER
jgi:folate-dependent phosphoribosylglycinamide formyltransferase PurN